MKTCLKMYRVLSIFSTLAVVVGLAPLTAQAQFDFVTNNGTLTLTRYTGAGGGVTIPSETNGLPVTGIANNAFYYYASLTSVTIPNSVISLGNSAFYHCYYLSNAPLPDSLATIGNDAFEGCYRLPTITIPNSVTNVGSDAFFGCSGATNVMIGTGVATIGSEAFFGCAALTSITVDALNACYSSLDGVLFNKSQTALIQAPMRKAGAYAIPAGVTTISNSAFSSCSNLTSVIIPNGVTRIGSYTFEYCRSLVSVTLPSSLINIEWSAFQYCTRLASIAIPDSVTNIGDFAFDDCSSLTNVWIGSGVTSIGLGAFGMCPNLTAAYCRGDCPNGDDSIFFGAGDGTVYCLPGTTGWGPTFGGWPTTLWKLPYPVILSSGVQTNGFGFIISWVTTRPVAVEACTALRNSIWSPVKTNTLVNGSSYFADPQWTNYPTRFYRVRSP